MSGVGRGRGYTGRHNRGVGAAPDTDTLRAMHDLSPRATETRELGTEKKEKEKEKDKETRDKEELLMENLESISAEDDAVLKELLHVDEQFQPLLVLLEQFSPSEDGIQFNRKLRHFETTITNMCQDEDRLQQAFATFRAASLLNSITGRKLSAVGASFTRQQRQQVLRTTLLNVIMQGTYCKLDILERANPLFLINAANLMGDYFAEARLCNGNKVHILASPLLHYMRALLASDDIKAHRSLATQLMQNGRELLSVLSADLDELSIAIRLRILSPPPCGIIWLLLSSDMCLNKFLPLPNSLQQFYAAHLKLTAEDSYSEVSYGSWKKTDEEKDISHNISNVSLEDDAKPKLRPILGAGAALMRQNEQSVSQDSFDTWNSQKTNLSKRYDLNSWRQEEEKKDEPVYDPTVLPPNFTDYPPPRFPFPENFNNYLQQGDGAYIQNYNFYTDESERVTERTIPEKSIERPFPERIVERMPERVVERAMPERVVERTIPDRIVERSVPEKIVEKSIAEKTVDRATEKPERVNNEIQKNARKPVENWRKDKEKEEKANWSRKSRDNLSEEEMDKRSLSKSSRDSRPVNRVNRRNSEVSDSGISGKTPPRRHVSDVPRNNKYWDHDDRCDKDYNS